MPHSCQRQAGGIKNMLIAPLIWSYGYWVRQSQYKFGMINYPPATIVWWAVNCQKLSKIAHYQPDLHNIKCAYQIWWKSNVIIWKWRHGWMDGWMDGWETKDGIYRRQTDRQTYRQPIWSHNTLSEVLLVCLMSISTVLHISPDKRGYPPNIIWKILPHFIYHIYVFGQIGLSKECRPRWEATECNHLSGSTMFATHTVILRHNIG